MYDTTGQKKILEVKNLKQYFNVGTKNEVRAVDDVSFDIYEGETLGLVGESGCGKTTTGRAIIRLYNPTSGEIFFDGTEIHTLHDRKEQLAFRKDMQMIFQDPYNSFHPTYTIFEQIKDVIKNNYKKEELDEFLLKLSLDRNLLNKKPHELSGGQLQRCSILRALLMKPDLLLVDEPTSALDNIIAYDVMKLLINLLNNCAILLITHDLQMASWCSDKIIRLEENARK